MTNPVETVARLRRLPKPLNYVTGMQLSLPVNPDGPEAADLIETLATQVERLTEALESCIPYVKFHVRQDGRGKAAELLAKLQALSAAAQ
jgi:hypothetical protein